MEQRIFIGIFPAGISYADKEREVAGDYARLAFLPYDTLTLEVDRGCPTHLERQIRADVASMNLKKGQHFRTSTTGQTVLLGTKIP